MTDPSALPPLLYISINDGSDTRIVKEVESLSKAFSIHFIGIGRDEARAFARPFCRTFWLSRGHHREPLALARWYARVARALLTGGPWASVHIINENLLLMLWPLWPLRRRQGPARLVVDVFDSIFLRGGRRPMLERLAYGPPTAVLVTDADRLALLPPAGQAKARVVGNYPLPYQGPWPDKTGRQGPVRIFYSGSMSEARGSALLLTLLEGGYDLEVTMAGWIYDDTTRRLAQHPRVTNRGTVPQQEAMRLAAEADYILCLYAPTNENNLNASPNKIYDALQARTPVVINAEVGVSRFVAEHGLGLVTESFTPHDPGGFFQALAEGRGRYQWAESLADRYTWEAAEQELLSAHGA